MGESYIEQWRERHGVDPEQGNRTNAEPNTDQKTSGESTWIEQWRERHGLSQGKSPVDEFNRGVNVLNYTLDSWNRWYEASRTGLDGVGFGNAGNASAAIKDESASMLKRLGQSRKWAQENKDLLGDDYDKVMAMLQEATTGTYWVDKGYKDQTEYFSQWETQADYDQYIADKSQYENMAGGTAPAVDPERKTAAEYAADLDKLNGSIEAMDNYIQTLNARYSELENLDWNALAHGTEEEKRSYTTLRNEWTMVQQQLAQAQQDYDSMMSQKWQMEQDAQWMTVRENKDFNNYSGYVVNQIDDQGNVVNTSDDQLYRYINSRGGELFPFIREDHKKEDYDWIEKNVAKYSKYTMMTDAEIEELNYIYRTQGKLAASNYITWLGPTLDERAMGALQEDFAGMASQGIGGAIAANALSIPMMQIGGAGILNVAAQNAVKNLTGSYQPVNYNGAAMAPTRAAQAIRGTTAAAITDATGTIQLNEEKHPILAPILNGRGLADVYSIGMSGLDSKVAAMTGNAAAATTLLASSAASQGVLDALERGATDEEALTMGLWNGAFEAIFEFIEVDNLLKGNPNWIKNVVNQAITEGVGEGATTLANNIADAIIMADKSAINLAAQEYIAQGMDSNTARKKALIDAGVDLLWDTIGGAVSGAMSAGGISAVNAVTNQVQYAALPKIVKNSVKRLQGLGIGKESAIDVSIALYQGAEGYGDQAAAYMAAFDPNQDAYTYAADFRKAYEIGKNNGNREYLGKLSLNEDQRKIAYELGAAASRKAAQEAKAPKKSESDEERTYSVSDDGATIDSTGKKVTVKGFSSVGSKVTLELESGKTIDAKEVSFGTADEAILYETIGQVTGAASTANHILKSYETAAKEGMSASDFAAGLRQAYDLGVSGQVAERQLSTYELAGKLPAAARSAAFSRGKTVGQYKATTRQAALEAHGRQVKGQRQGQLHFDRKGRTFDSKRESSLKAMEALSKALGIDIYVYESYKEGGKRVYQDRAEAKKSAPNGWYDKETGAIHIDLNAGNFGQGTMMFTVAHELTHFINEWSPVKFRKLADLLVERYAEQGTSVRDLIDKQIVKAEENGRDIDRDTAFEEVVADSMETMLTQGDVAGMMAQLKQQDKTLWEKVRDWFKDLAQKLQAVVEQYKGAKPETAEGQLVAQMEDFIQVLQQAYAEALVEAGENYRASGGQKNTTQEGGVKYQARAGGYDYSKPFAQQLEDYQKGLITKGDTLLVGPTPDVLKGIGLTALPVTINTTHIDYALNGTKDFDHHLGKALLSQLPDAIKEPVAIMTSAKKSGSSIVMMLEIRHNGKHIVVPMVVDGFGHQNGLLIDSNAVTSAYGKNNSISKVLRDAIDQESNGQFRLFYLDQNKATALLQVAKVPMPKMPATHNGGYIHTISDPGSPVKSKISSQTDTIQFRNWFGNSKIVNADGSPKVMYHGSQAQFDSFDRKKARSSGTYGNGFYFTDSTSHAGTYGNLYAVYLSIKNPLQSGKSSVTKSQVRKFLEAVAENEDYSIENYGTYDIDKVLKSVMGGLGKADAFKVIQDINVTAIGNMVEAVELFNEVNGTNYDGIVAETETVAFLPTQIKSATDNVGTFDKGNTNIYYSDRDAGAEKVVQALEKQNAKLKEDVKDLRELLRLQGKLTHGTEFTRSSIEAAMQSLTKTAMAKLDTEGRQQLNEMLKDFYRYIATDKELAWEGVAEKAGQIADFLMDYVTIKPQRDGYADEVLRNLRGARVRLSDSQRAEVEKLYGYENYRKMLFGAGIYLSRDGMELYSFWHEQASEFPGTFTEDVYEGDQPTELLSIIDAMREGDDSAAMEYAYNREFIRQDLMRAVYDSYWRVDNLKTVADRKQKEIEEIRRKHRERMTELKEEQRHTVRDLNEKRRADIAAVRKEYQEKNRKQLDAMRERHKESRERANESRSAAHQRQSVEKAAKSLMDMLSRPTKEAHVPMALQAPLEKFLNSIDFSSKRALAGGELTIKDVAYTRALQEVKTAIAQQRTALEGAADGTFSLDVPKDFLDRIEEHINLINKATEGLDLTTSRVYEMTSDELKDLAFILKTINKAIRDIDKLHMAGAKARVSELSRSTVWEMGRRKAVKTEDGGRFMWRNYTPTFAFERMGTAATQVLNGLKMGQAKLARTAASVIKFSEDTYTNKEVKAWENEIHEVKLDSGKTAKMTTAQVMSFYCLSRREQARGHLNGGGIRMGNIGEGRKMIRQTDHFRLTQEDIAKINGLLTDRQRKVADQLQRYMADVGGRLGNEISMARWDYMEMTDRDYFPIRSDSDVHDAKNPDQDKTNLWALLNKSFTKQVTKGANDAMIVSSIFDVFADHMSDMAEYNAFALPLVDAMKWYNYRETEKQENGQIKTIGVKKAINDKLGTAAGEYFIDLMTDINSSQKAGRYEDFFGKLLSRSKAASVGWNLRVAIQQPTAILRASVYLDPKSLVKGTAKIGMKKSAEEMKKYSGIALWKSLGYYDLNISRGIRDQIKGDTTLLDKINDAGMWLPGKVDEQTWARIWESCKEQVRRQQKLTGERLLEETAKLFEDVVYHTQVADSVLTRSGLMRSKSQTMKEWTSFMAEPTLSVNLLMNAFQDYREGVSKGEKAKRTMKILFCGYVLSAMANAIFTAFADAARDDDEYEGYWDKFFQALLGEKFYDGNLFAELNPLEKIVFVRDVLSLLRGYEGTKNPFVELVENGIKLVQNIVKFFQGKGSLTAYGLIYQSLQVLGGFTGAAPANLMREATTIWNWTFGKWNNMIVHRYKTSEKDSIRNAYESGAISKAEARDALVASGETIADAYYMIKGWDAGEKVGVYDDVYSAALAGKDISAAVAEAVKYGEKTEKEVLSQLKSQIKKWYTDSESDTKITREQAQEMVDSYLGLEPEAGKALVEEWAFELEHGYSYDDIKFTYLDDQITSQEAKDVLMSRLGKTEAEADLRIQYWEYLRYHRDSKLTEYQVADYYEYAEPAGIASDVYERYIEGVKGIEGQGTKVRKMAVIDQLPLTDEQKDALYFANDWAKSTLHEAPWH